MYLLGLMLWVAASGGIAWLVAKVLSGRSKKLWLRPLLASVLMPVVFLAPLADEIIGKFQFDRLCEEAKEVKIHATHPVREELYTPEGKWRGSDTGDDVAKLSEIKKHKIRWEPDSLTTEIVSTAIPIRKRHTRIFDQIDGRLLAEWDSYSTSGGWLSQNFETPILIRSQCLPSLFENRKLEQTLLPFKSDKGGMQ